MRILVVDDEFAAISKLKALLSEYGECDAAESGRLALEMHHQAIYKKEPYGLITLDIEMPGISGLQLIEIMTTQEKKGEVPLSKKIMVTASGTRNNVIDAARRHCDSFIVKPVRRSVLAAKLEELGITKLE